jgi:hypothetical protein
LVPDVGKNNSNLYKSKLKKAKKPSKQENCSGSRYCFQDPTFSGLVGLEVMNSIKILPASCTHPDPSVELVPIAVAFLMCLALFSVNVLTTV